MLRNLEVTNGAIYAENVSLAMAEKIGKAGAHELLEKFSREAQLANIPLKEFLVSKPEIKAHLSIIEIEALFELYEK